MLVVQWILSPSPVFIRASDGIINCCGIMNNFMAEFNQFSGNDEGFLLLVEARPF